MIPGFPFSAARYWPSTKDSGTGTARCVRPWNIKASHQLSNGKMNEVLANNSHRLFIVTDVRCPWLMSVCRSQDTNVHISVLQWRRFAWDEQLVNWDNVKAEWMIGIHKLQETCQFGNLKRFQLAIYKCMITEFGFIWFCDFCIWDVWIPFDKMPGRATSGGSCQSSQKTRKCYLCSCNREWFETYVNAESPSSMIQFGKNTFDHVQKLEVQNKRHGSPGVTWWRWRTWMMRCGRSFCFPSTHGRLEVASTKVFKLILFVIIPGGKRSMQTNKTGIVDITPSKWQTVAKRDSQLQNSKRLNDIHVSPVSVSIARMLLHASWVPASISGDPEPKRKLTKSCQLVNSQDSQGPRCGCNCVKDWDLAIELLGDGQQDQDRSSDPKCAHCQKGQSGN